MHNRILLNIYFIYILFIFYLLQGEVVLVQYAYPVRCWGRADGEALAARLQQQVASINAKYNYLGIYILNVYFNLILFN